LLLGALLAAAEPAEAQTTSTAGTGFQLNRYEPTAAGEWSFWVNHPWYSSTRYFAAGITLNYAHDPLIFGTIGPDSTFSQTQAVVAHQLIGHIDLAGSFLDRVLLTASLPIVFLERGGTPAGGIAAAEQASVGDLRFGAMVRLWGQPYRSPFSISVGGEIWVPFRQFVPDSLPVTSSDTFVRGLPRVVIGGLASKVLWSFTAGVLIRPHATLGDPALGAEANSELQFGAAIAYANTDLRLAVGPELVASTAIVGDRPFSVSTTNIEALLGIHYNVAHVLQLGLGGGVGILRQAGTPDGRALLRIAYAPWPKAVAKDRDHDGIPDEQDRCPDDPKGSRPDPERLGCPLSDRDGDGVIDSDDLCPDVPQGRTPDPDRKGCPIGDRDKDGVLDNEDMCPDMSQGQTPDPGRRGCPAGDRDNDGVLDNDDLCPDQPQGQTPDPTRKGCPAGDRDKDGVFDHEDLCPDQPQGPLPDAQKKGCPAPDRDKDSVSDPVDACPDQPGAPNPDPKKNGCPGLVEVKGGQIVIVKPVFFATDKDVILKQSFEVLQSVSDALKGATHIKKVRVEGHTDDRGKVEHNTELSDRRAKSVMAWLVEHGIDQSRLEAKGYGPSNPIADNKTSAGRAKNRRVDFVIIDPPQAEGVKVESGASIEAPSSPDQNDKAEHKKGHRTKKDKADAKKDDAKKDKADAKKDDGAKPAKAKKASKDKKKSKTDK